MPAGAFTCHNRFRICVAVASSTTRLLTSQHSQVEGNHLINTVTAAGDASAALGAPSDGVHDSIVLAGCEAVTVVG